MRRPEGCGIVDASFVVREETEYNIPPVIEQKCNLEIKYNKIKLLRVLRNNLKWLEWIG